MQGRTPLRLTSHVFDVTSERGRIVLTPVRINRADSVRAKLEQLGITESDVADAVKWARQGSEPVD